MSGLRSQLEHRGGTTGHRRYITSLQDCIKVTGKWEKRHQYEKRAKRIEDGRKRIAGEGFPLN